MNVSVSPCIETPPIGSVAPMTCYKTFSHFLKLATVAISRNHCNLWFSYLLQLFPAPLTSYP